jgi:hypothetical protein
MRTRTKRFAATEIVVAIESFTTETNRVVKMGDRLRGGDELVKLAPHLFVADGSTSEEIGAARAAMLPDHVEPSDPNGPKVLGEIPPERRLIATRDRTARLPDGSVWFVHAGELADANDERVVAILKFEPDLFEKAPPIGVVA